MNEPIIVNSAGPTWAQRQHGENVITGSVRAGLVVFDPSTAPIEYGDVIPAMTVQEIGEENGFQ